MYIRLGSQMSNYNILEEKWFGGNENLVFTDIKY